eukprot:CAMPEP_0178465784 /NCGR_PEP_ID=MMETSP0689_2-20121128/51541_1 /TAXON_ID=160604 /ORGANISM="Amphidinium massartii, Strain CS-259" /LENGTH=552 /DNA_ID=CAMNT_0020092737 /DNA_START=381 /DNA_END=2039 /DNA_ORIENTATION=+
MRAEWFDACSALTAFMRFSKEDPSKVMEAKNILIRLFSMLHAAALAELEEVNGEDVENIRAFTFNLIDIRGIDEESLRTLKRSPFKVELIFEWIQNYIVECITTGVLSIPPPILSRAFQEAANGMVAFHDALKITYIPFPFPYAQTCDCLLFFHLMVAPVVTSQWVQSAPWAGLFVFVQVFILWSLNFIAVEIENPFGTDANDLDGEFMQDEMNTQLLMLLQNHSAKLPRLSEDAQWSPDPLAPCPATCETSFLQVWSDLGITEEIAHTCREVHTTRAEHALHYGVPLEKHNSKPKLRFSKTINRATSRVSLTGSSALASKNTAWTQENSPGEDRKGTMSSTDTLGRAVSKNQSDASTGPAVWVPLETQYDMLDSSSQSKLRDAGPSLDNNHRQVDYPDLGMAPTPPGFVQRVSGTDKMGQGPPIPDSAPKQLHLNVSEPILENVVSGEIPSISWQSLNGESPKSGSSRSPRTRSNARKPGDDSQLDDWARGGGMSADISAAQSPAQSDVRPTSHKLYVDGDGGSSYHMQSMQSLVDVGPANGRPTRQVTES